MSSDQQSKALADLTSVITLIELKLSELSIDLEVAKRNLAVLKEKQDQAGRKVSYQSIQEPSSQNKVTRRSKRQKEFVQGTNSAYSSPIHDNHTFVIGNRIRILNPSNKKQSVPGEVTGYTKDGLTKVKLDNGVKTRRASKNLALTKAHH